MLSKQYLALLDIKMIIRQWQDLDISDDNALLAIAAVLDKDKR